MRQLNKPRKNQMVIVAHYYFSGYYNKLSKWVFLFEIAKCFVTDDSLCQKDLNHVGNEVNVLPLKQIATASS